MYGDDELQEKAVERKHMIFSEAAFIAEQSHSKELWLTHFSPSLREPRIHRYRKSIFRIRSSGKT
jgi:ribonuclease Z